MKRSTVYRITAVLLLGAMAAQRYQTLRRPVDVSQYHARIREAATKVPTRIEGWVGSDIPVPVQATTLLQPNVILSRRYLNLESGKTAGVLLVHCSDAHDMAGHFPLRCYPAQGWKLQRSTPHEWQVGPYTVPGMEYQFSKVAQVGERGGGENLIVCNFLMRPGGLLLRNMDEMTRSIRGAGGQAAGAAQVQVYFGSDITEEDRKRAFITLMNGYKPLLDAILSDAEH
jgi:hypothetical protein